MEDTAANVSVARTKEEQAEHNAKYYNSDDGWRFYTIVNGSDYSGVGRYDNQCEETDDTGYKYIRGDNVDITAATKKRDEEVLQFVLGNAPEGKLKCLELGSGRGALGRHVAYSLFKAGRLEHYTAMNIAQLENDYSMSKVPEDLKPHFNVKLGSFDDILTLYKEGTDAFDVIISTDAMYHSADKALLVKSMAKLVKKGGMMYFCDYLTNPESPPEVLKKINERFHPSDLYDFKGYEAALAETDMKKVMVKDDTITFRKHVGVQWFLINGAKKAELTDPNNGLTPGFWEIIVPGIKQWLTASADGHMQWGHFLYKKE